MSELKHIAFIVDGNRRWAKKFGLSSFVGHKKGFDLLIDLTKKMPAYGLTHVTYYVFSVENWKRTEEEISYLLDLFRDIFDTQCKNFINSGMRFRAIGNLALLPSDVREKINFLEQSTACNDKLVVTFAISYGGRDEIVRATKKIVQNVMEGKIEINSIDEQMFAKYLDAPDNPYPDVIIRTSESRISNFLLWQIAYSEISFIDKFWPDFNEDDLKFVVDEFRSRERRYGQ